MVSVHQMAHKNQMEKMSTHPLDSLNSEEISTAVASVKANGGLDEGAWFETISRDEPGRKSYPMAPRAVAPMSAATSHPPIEPSTASWI